MGPKSKRVVNVAAYTVGALLVLAFLLGPAIYKLAGNAEAEKHIRVASDIQTLRSAIGTYKMRNGAYPTTGRGLVALGSPSPKDPWANGYIYRCPGLKFPNGYDLFSAGPDRIPDTADDDWGQ